VKRVKPADLDAEFLKRHDYDDVDEMRQDLRRKILRAKERERDRLAEDRLIDDLLAHSAIPLPEEVVSEAVATWAERRRISAQAEGVDEETVTKALAADEGDVRSSVEGDLRRHFVLERIAEAVDAKVSEQELVGAVEQIARDSGRAPGEVLAHFREEPHRLMELRDHLRNQKARDALRKAAAVIEEAPAAGPAKPEKAEKPGKGK
jgi:trigger factor